MQQLNSLEWEVSLYKDQSMLGDKDPSVEILSYKIYIYYVIH